MLAYTMGFGKKVSFLSSIPNYEYHLEAQFVAPWLPDREYGYHFGISNDKDLITTG